MLKIFKEYEKRDRVSNKPEHSEITLKRLESEVNNWSSKNNVKVTQMSFDYANYTIALWYEASV
jgi:hypothetical protein